MIEDSINLTGKWIVSSKSNGDDFTSYMELVHHGNRVMGLEEGGETEYFLEGRIFGNEGKVRYRGILFLDHRTGRIAGEGYTGTYYFHIKAGGEQLRGHYEDDSDPERPQWRARRDRP